MTLSPLPGPLPVVYFRVVKPTTRWEAVLQFYAEGIGLTKLDEFRNNKGYDGVMLGLPGREHHLEIIRREGGEPNPNPNPDNLLVFYFRDAQTIRSIVDRLGAMGYAPGTALNRWWGDHGAAVVYDPDGWGVGLYPLTNEDVAGSANRGA